MLHALKAHGTKPKQHAHSRKYASSHTLGLSLGQGRKNVNSGDHSGAFEEERGTSSQVEKVTQPCLSLSSVRQCLTQTVAIVK